MVDDHAIHMDILPDDYVSDQEIPRKSQDNAGNCNGQLLLKFLKQSGLRIANERVCEDKQIGAYTFVGSRGSSFVDCCIVNTELLSVFFFSSFSVHDPNLLSDHCPTEFAFSSSFVLDLMKICILIMMEPIFITINWIIILRKSISPLYILAFLKKQCPH